MDSRRNILIAPLDWGLGHATRCIPLIRVLQEMGHRVVIASTGPSGMLLEQEFPNLERVELPGFSVTYSRQPWMSLHLARQVPGFLKSIRQEHTLTQRIVSEWGIDTIISDNRYGVWSKSCKNIIITHQLFLPVPRLAKDWATRFVFDKIAFFDQCWVPDLPGKLNLSGALSHRSNLPENVHFIGVLSRFSVQKEAVVPGTWLAMISGPEPSRSLFARQLNKFFIKNDITATLIGGDPSQGAGMRTEGKVTHIHHLPAPEMESLIARHENIICRAGYSSIMDLAAMHRTAWIVPTPGQREQEYLARYLQNQGWFHSVLQSRIQEIDV
ncbi:MAG: hypothetical protein RL220_2116, partial [Bacteroidota bacterium]